MKEKINFKYEGQEDNRDKSSKKVALKIDQSTKEEKIMKNIQVKEGRNPVQVESSH